MNNFPNTTDLITPPSTANVPRWRTEALKAKVILRLEEALRGVNGPNLNKTPVELEATILNKAGDSEEKYHHYVDTSIKVLQDRMYRQQQQQQQYMQQQQQQQYQQLGNTSAGPMIQHHQQPSNNLSLFTSTSGQQLPEQQQRTILSSSTSNPPGNPQMTMSSAGGMGVATTVGQVPNMMIATVGALNEQQFADANPGDMMPQHPMPQGQQQRMPNMQGGQMPMQQQQMMNMRPQMGGMPPVSSGPSQLQQRLMSSHQQGQPRMGGMPPQHMMGGGPGSQPRMAGMMMAGGAGGPGQPQPRGPPPMYGLSPRGPVGGPPSSGGLMTPGGSPMMMNPSPMGGYINSGGPGSVGPPPGVHGGMVPSPLSGPPSVGNIGSSPAARGPPSSEEDQAYVEKVRQLSIYIEPLRRMIARIGAEDNVKREKMKKLLDILSNPSKRLPMETLKKCEDVLVRMKFDVEYPRGQQPPTIGSQGQQPGGPGGDGSQVHTNQQVHPPSTSNVNPLLEAVLNVRKNAASSTHQTDAVINHAMQSTFSAPLEAVFGTEVTVLPLKSRKRRREDDEEDSGIPFVLEREMSVMQSQFKVSVESRSSKHSLTPVIILCKLKDPHLPDVPDLTVSIPHNYPQGGSPKVENSMSQGFAGTMPFLKRAQSAFEARLSKMPARYTLTQLMGIWEMSIRAACSPKAIEAEAKRESVSLGV